MMTDNIHDIPPESIKEACRLIKMHDNLGTPKRLKGKNHYESTYLRWVSSQFEEVLKENLHWDTRYLGGGKGHRGRTKIIFERAAIRALWKVFGFPEKHVGPSL